MIKHKGFKNLENLKILKQKHTNSIKNIVLSYCLYISLIMLHLFPMGVSFCCFSPQTNFVIFEVASTYVHCVMFISPMKVGAAAAT